MAATEIEAVRRFNRLVTQRVGALEDNFLHRGRSLGASRVLWEIGRGGSDVRALRRRLGLDAGYLSRLLRALETEGLVEIGPHPADRRVRTARLTRRGLGEVGVLDRRSEAEAEAVLAPLSQPQRERLLTAMAETERLLAATLVELDVVDPTDAAARSCLDRYAVELDRRFEHGFVAARSPIGFEGAGLDEVRPPVGMFVLAVLLGEPVGCGGLVLHEAEPAMLKRMWVAEEVRGIGLGRRLLADLERRAAEAGATRIRLDTNRVLVEAIAMYRAAGYREVQPFSDEPYAHHWFEKVIPASE